MHRTMLVAVVVLALAGCLPPEQQARVEAIRLELMDISQTAEELWPKLAELNRKIADVYEAITQKRLPIEEGKALIESYMAEKDFLIARGRELQESAEALKTELEALRAEGVPWWRIAGVIVLALLTGGAGIKMRTTANVLGAVIRGVEKAGDQAVKKAIAAEAGNAGVASALHAEVKRLT